MENRQSEISSPPVTAVLLQVRRFFLASGATALGSVKQARREFHNQTDSLPRVCLNFTTVLCWHNVLGTHNTPISQRGLHENIFAKRETNMNMKVTPIITVLLLCVVQWPTASQGFSVITPFPLSDPSEERSLAEVRYRLDANRSRFMLRAFAGGLLWFKGHDHFIAVRDFAGEVRLTPQAISPASLEMTIRSNSLEETRDVFTEQQKQIINRELREIVLETEKYPSITFKSTNVTGKLLRDGSFEGKIEGELTMHGVTRRIRIPTRVNLVGNDLRAQGEFTVDRSDFNVKATSAFHGTVRVRNKLKFTFDIMAHRY